MKTVRIIALHLAYGGIEKAIMSMANLFAEQYRVEILSVYNMPGGPAFPLDERVAVRYLLDEIPNREEWKAAVKSLNPVSAVKESVRGVRIIRDKKRAVIEAVKSVHDGVLITTRPEDNVVLSKYGDRNVLKIAQLHQDHRFDKKLMGDFKNSYDNIDVFALLTPQLVEEVGEMMGDNGHTRLVCVPNFLDHYPEKVELEKKKKIILAVGRLHEVKGFDRLISCFAAVHEKAPDWELRIVGEGEERGKLESLIAELGLGGCVTLTGRLDSAGVEREMLSASIFAMTSRSEGLPFVLIEAQSCGLPAVAFDVRVGPRAVLTDGKDAFLVPDRDEKMFCEKTLELINSETLREQMARSAMTRSRDFSREKIKQLWTGIIGE
ncbi:MAG: glycosyltransferase [Candidatus Limivicinus sp.]